MLSHDTSSVACGPAPSAAGPRDPLAAILAPSSVAVIGAGRDPDSMSGKLFRNLLERFTGTLCAVNPKATAIEHVRSYASVLELPQRVDLAIVAVPAACVPLVVRQCAARAIGALVVISAGFSETGQSGDEQSLLDLVRRAGMRLVGPNCVGVINTDPAVQLNATFSPFFPLPGNVAICTQSGALGVVIPEYARRSGIGVSSLVSVGNKADLGENDCLRYWEHDPATKVIALYLESFQDPRELLSLARRIGRAKPIVALKAGRTPAGSRAAGSHTAALASPQAAAEALFRQAGVIPAHSLDELFNITALLASQPTPAGNRVALLTNAGGPGVLAADALESQGLTVPELSSDLQASLRRFLPPEAATRNPIDLIGSVDAGQYAQCLRSLLDCDEADSVIVIYVPRTPASSGPILAAVREAAADHQRACAAPARCAKPILAVLMETSDVPTAGADAPAIPVYRYPEAAATALARATDYGRWRRGDEGYLPSLASLRISEARQIIQLVSDRLGPSGGWLLPAEVFGLLAAFGLRVARWEIVHDAGEALAAAHRLRYPLAVKVVSPTQLHKSDVGGVVLDVQSDEALRAAFAQVTRAVSDARGAIVQQFVSGGRETLVGVTHDAAFGHLIGFGLGGVYVELLDQLAFRMHPLTDRDARELLRETRAAKMLGPYRGRPAADVAAVEDALLRVSALVDAVPELAELDINPLLVMDAGRGACVADARLRLAGAWGRARKQENQFKHPAKRGRVTVAGQLGKDVPPGTLKSIWRQAQIEEN